jgi:glycosyltransferase involved in cell wall biosynthesis
MKVTIAADLAPNKMGSLECLLFTTGNLLQASGRTVSYLFSGATSAAVRQRFGLRLDGALVEDLGSLDDPSCFDAWLAALAKEQPDVLWLHFFPLTGSFAQRVRRACPKARIVLSERVSRGFVRRNPLKALYCRLRAAAAAHCIDQYLPVSDFVARRLREVDYVPAAKIHTVYNGIDLSRFPPRQGPGTYVAAVCHMRAVKGIPVLVRALDLLAKRGIRPETRLIGEGPELDSYRADVRQRGLDHVQFLGLRDDVPEQLSGAAVVVVPSIWPEAFSLAAGEAMAAGAPVVASRVGALPEVVDDGVTGVLVPPQDVEALAAALESLLADPARRESQGRAGRERAAKLFDLQNQARQLVSILQN